MEMDAWTEHVEDDGKDATDEVGNDVVKDRESGVGGKEDGTVAEHIEVDAADDDADDVGDVKIDRNDNGDEDSDWVGDDGDKMGDNEDNDEKDEVSVDNEFDAFDIDKDDFNKGKFIPDDVIFNDAELLFKDLDNCKEDGVGTKDKEGEYVDVEVEEVTKFKTCDVIDDNFFNGMDIFV